MSAILVLGAGVHQIPYIRRIGDRELRTIAVDADLGAPGAALSNVFVPARISNRMPEREIQSLLRHLNQEVICGVLVAGVELAVLGAQLAERLNVPGLPEEVALNATDKLRRLKCLSAAGIRVPRFHTLNASLQTLDQSGSSVVIKPRFGSGSRGVHVLRRGVDPAAERKFLQKLNTGSQYIVEELIDGVEYSVEAFLVDGRPLTFCLARRHMTIRANGAVEDWGSDSDPELHDASALISALTAGSAALGLTTGSVKGDLVVSGGEVWTLEIAARSAPLAPLVAEQVTGFDAIGIQIANALGESLDAFEPPRPPDSWVPWVHRYARPRLGTLVDLKNLEAARQHDRALAIINLLEPKLPAAVDPARVSDRPFYVAASGESIRNAQESASHLISLVEQIYE